MDATARLPRHELKTGIARVALSSHADARVHSQPPTPLDRASLERSADDVSIGCARNEPSMLQNQPMSSATQDATTIDPATPAA